MGILADHQIRSLLEEGRLVVDPLPEEHIQPASIDLTLGEEVFRASDDNKQRLSEGEVLSLPAGEAALILTRERIEMGDQLAGQIGLRSSFSRKGVDLLAGPQIDPDFEGPLHVYLINLSPADIVIEYGQRILTVEIHELDEAAKTPYEGRYQAEPHITAGEISDIKEGEGIALSEAVKAMRNMARDVSSMEDTVENLSENVERNSREVRWTLRISAGALVSLTVGVLGALGYGLIA